MDGRDALKALIAGLDSPAGVPVRPALSFGLGPLDRALGGGLARAALHELAPGDADQFGAASGLAAALAGRALAAEPRRDALWIVEDRAGRRGGLLHAPGLSGLGLAPERLVLVPVRDAGDALWAAEEALKCPAVAVVVVELAGPGKAAELTASRRLALAARAGGGLGLLLRGEASPAPCAAHSRWLVWARPGRPDRFGGLGQTAWELALTRNRNGPEGRWLVEWNAHDHGFAVPAPALPVVAAPADRPARPALRHA